MDRAQLRCDKPGTEAQRRKGASHVYWACSPSALATDTEPASVSVIDPTARDALLSAATGLHKGRLHMEKSLSGPLMRGLGFTSQLA